MVDNYIEEHQLEHLQRRYDAVSFEQKLAVDFSEFLATMSREGVELLSSNGFSLIDMAKRYKDKSEREDHILSGIGSLMVTNSGMLTQSLAYAGKPHHWQRGAK